MGLPRSAWYILHLMVCPWSVIWCTFLSLDSVSSFHFGSEFNVPFNFYKSLLLSFLFFFLGGTFLELVIGKIGFPLWGNCGWIISLHGTKFIHCWCHLLISTEPPSLSIESINNLKRSKNNRSLSGHLLEEEIFFTRPKSGTFSIIPQFFDVDLIVIPTWLNQ